MQELHCRVAILLPSKGCTQVTKADTARACPAAGFHRLKQLGVLLLPCEWGANLIHSKPQWYVVKTHVYTWVERNDMGCSFLSNKTMRYQGQVSNCQPPDLKSEALTLCLFNGKNIRSD